MGQSQSEAPAFEFGAGAAVLADGLAVRRYDTPAGGVPARHAHRYHHLLLAARDMPATRVALAGAGVEATPREGGLLVWPAGQPGEVRCDGRFRCVSLQLAPDRLDRAAALLFGDRAVVWNPVAWAADPFVYESANRLLTLADAPLPGGALLAESIASAVAQHVLLRYARPAEPRDTAAGLSPTVLAAVVAFIDRRLAESLSLDQLAGVAGLSPYYFARLFRAATGEPPHRFVLARRLTAAAALLADGDTPVAEIALRCGFAGQSHLHQHFKARFGATPGAYRCERRTGRR